MRQAAAEAELESQLARLLPSVAVCSVALLPAPGLGYRSPSGAGAAAAVDCPRVLVSRYVRGRPPLVVELPIPPYPKPCPSAPAGDAAEVRGLRARPDPA